MDIFWHRRDLRIPDNRGLALAAKNGPTLPVYVVDTEMLKQIGKRQRALLVAGVETLKRRYRERGSDLLVRAGEPAETLQGAGHEGAAQGRDLRWHRLDIERVTEASRVHSPDLSRVTEVGFTDLMRGGGSPASTRIDWVEVWGQAVPNARPE